MYLFGVAKALQEFELDKNARVIGCSAGALTAAGLALRCDFDAIRDHVVKNIIPQAHASLAGYFRVRSYLRDTLRRHGELHRFEELNASQQVTIVYTSLSSLKSRRATTFKSVEQITETLLASCCATPIAGLPFKLNGEWVMDGCIFDFQPVYDDKTVTVSPFYFLGADIKPSVYVPMWWSLFPPGVSDIEWLFDLGYEDGLSKAVVFGAAAKLLISNIIMAILAVAMITLGCMVLLVGGLNQASTMASADWQRCRSYMRSITSLSLFLHSIPVIGSKIQIKRHEFLLEHSLVYRVAMHFV
ncbi:hypothetical protein PsorP6_002545 [Peronosclerospora sorghi]|uniref:Uncharacterized protein n=1 Tax=Peronosclerospora sorghi TaxID=230839 RepID=A0ACC0WVA5_9STRA|nr:hypothetical protein PsorP6_002545 [Peronosclerospora sorghi]